LRILINSCINNAHSWYGFLSKVSLVILTDEAFSSQICSACENKLGHSKVIEDINKKKQSVELKKAQTDVSYVTKMDRIKKGREIKCELKENMTKKKRETKEKELRSLAVEKECYKLCCCKNKKCGHKLWHRDVNAPINMMTIMRRKLTEQQMGVFEKTK